MMEYNDFDFDIDIDIDIDIDLDIKERAKELIEQSGMLKYADKERFEQLFSNIHILETNSQLQEKQGIFLTSSETKEGFSENGHIFAGPEATPHTIIREILREMSTKVNRRGMIEAVGIIENGRNQAETELNNGLIEHLATKISGESSNYHGMSKRVFAELEPLIMDYAKDSDILMKTLLENGNYIHQFVRGFSKPESANQILYGLYYIENERVYNSIKDVKKRYSRYTIIQNIKNKINAILFQKKRKALPVVTGEPKDETKEEKWRKSQAIGIEKNERLTHLEFQQEDNYQEYENAKLEDSVHKTFSEETEH